MLVWGNRGCRKGGAQSVNDYVSQGATKSKHLPVKHPGKVRWLMILLEEQPAPPNCRWHRSTHRSSLPRFSYLHRTLTQHLGRPSAGCFVPASNQSASPTDTRHLLSARGVWRERNERLDITLHFEVFRNPLRLPCFPRLTPALLTHTI